MKFEEEKAHNEKVAKAGRKIFEKVCPFEGELYIYAEKVWASYPDMENWDSLCIDVKPENKIALTFELLEKISAAFYTKKINVSFYPEHDAYSEYTPGNPANFTITIILDHIFLDS